MTMKRNIFGLFVIVALALSASSCIKETFPTGSTVTDDQIQKYTAQFQEPEQFTGHEPELKPRMDIFFMEGL